MILTLLSSLVHEFKISLTNSYRIELKFWVFKQVVECVIGICIHLIQIFLRAYSAKELKTTVVECQSSVVPRMYWGLTVFCHMECALFAHIFEGTIRMCIIQE